MKTIINEIGSTEIISTYVNDYSPEKNLVLHYLNENKMASEYLHPNFRLKDWIIKLDIHASVSKNGDLIAFSDRMNLFARIKR